jgi:(1->4)-alpha-D-glucan 1-alpha-D-glucosylmutase
VHAAVDAVFESEEVRSVLVGLAARIDAAAEANSLAAKLLALTIPGVPDVYQGSELWETSLVDPDNRRPVDFEHRAAVLAGTADDDAAAKLHVTCSALTLRRDRPELFTSYAPVTATGPAAGHVVAYDRGGAISVVTRLPAGLALAGGWGSTVLDLPDGRWHDVLTGLDTDGGLASLLAVHPVALLVRMD